MKQFSDRDFASLTPGRVVCYMHRAGQSTIVTQCEVLLTPMKQTVQLRVCSVLTVLKGFSLRMHPEPQAISLVGAILDVPQKSVYCPELSQEQLRDLPVGSRLVYRSDIHNDCTTVQVVVFAGARTDGFRMVLVERVLIQGKQFFTRDELILAHHSQLYFV